MPEGIVKDGNLIETSFPVGVIVATAAKKEVVECTDDDLSGLDLELAVEEDADIFPGLGEQEVIPFPTGCGGFTGKDMRRLGTGLEDETAGVTAFSSDPEMQGLGTKTMVIPTGKDPATGVAAIIGHSIPEPE